MNDDTRWVVDTTPSIDTEEETFGFGFYLLTSRSIAMLDFLPEERAEIRDFIIELVHEIEALQTENIKLRDLVEKQGDAMVNQAELVLSLKDAISKQNHEISILGGKLMDYADRLVELGPANPREDNDE